MKERGEQGTFRILERNYLQGSHLHLSSLAQHYLRGDENRCLFTPERELKMMNQSLDNSKIQVGEPMNFIGVTFRKAGVG